MKWVFPIGISVGFWSFVGIVRYVFEKIFPKQGIKRKKLNRWVAKTAICLSAHNEKDVIARSIRSLIRLVPPEQIFIASDGSTDRTAIISKRFGCNVIEINPGIGKAAALETLTRKFNLFKRFKFILIADADTIFPKSFLRKSLPFFLDKKVVAVSAHAKTKWYRGFRLSKKMYFVSFRTRLWRLLQWMFVYGQSWRYLNVLPVIPGYASLYRSEILRKLKISIPGLAIEDFNLGFQVHKKKLGVIAHHPSVYATTQEPDNLRDYWKQVKRWNVGIFQTIRYWKMWPSFFWVSLTIFLSEVILSTIFFLIVPLLILFLSSYYFAFIFTPFALEIGDYIDTYYFSLIDLFVLIFLFDYLLTLIVALKDKKYLLVLYGIGFNFLRFVDALIVFASIRQGFFGSSSGKWESPQRIK